MVSDKAKNVDRPNKVEANSQIHEVPKFTANPSSPLIVDNEEKKTILEKTNSIRNKSASSATKNASKPKSAISLSPTRQAPSTPSSVKKSMPQVKATVTQSPASNKKRMSTGNSTASKKKKIEALESAVIY